MSRPKLQLTKSHYREAKGLSGGLGFSLGRGRGSSGFNSLGAGWQDDPPAKCSLAHENTSTVEGQFEHGDTDDDEEILLPTVASLFSSSSPPPSAPFSSGAKTIPPSSPAAAVKPRVKLSLRLERPPSDGEQAGRSNNEQDNKQALVKSVKSPAWTSPKWGEGRISLPSTGLTPPSATAAPSLGGWFGCEENSSSSSSSSSSSYEGSVASFGVKPQHAAAPVVDSSAAAAPTQTLNTLSPVAPVSAAETDHFFQLLSNASTDAAATEAAEAAAAAAAAAEAAPPTATTSSQFKVNNGQGAGSGDEKQQEHQEHRQQHQEHRLPVDAHRAAILTSVREHAVTVIRGETGCGKSSRVPQFILDSDQHASVVVAQPRRLAAVTLARRVAAERGEKGCGGTVGFRVGQASKAGPHTRLTFVTVGYLLQRIVHHFAAAAANKDTDDDDDDNDNGDHNGRLKEKKQKQQKKKNRRSFEYTHVIIDEVHERDLETDLLCLAVRMLLKKEDDDEENDGDCGGEGLLPPPFKLILMSATFDANEFVTYFRPACNELRGRSVGCPLAVGGKRHPVAEVYAEELYQKFPCLAKFETSEHRMEKFLHQTFQGFLSDRGGGGGCSSGGCRGGGGHSNTSNTSSSSANIPDGMFRLGARLVVEVARAQPGEGILVFLSGLGEIQAMAKHLREVLAEEEAEEEEQEREGYSEEDNKGAFGRCRLSNGYDDDDGDDGYSGRTEDDSDPLQRRRRRRRRRRRVNVKVSVLHSFIDLAAQAATFDQVSAAAATVVTTEPTSASTSTSSSFSLPHHPPLKSLSPSSSPPLPPPLPPTFVVLATNLAESSLTLPNLRTVIDFGVHKEVAHASSSSSTARHGFFTSSPDGGGGRGSDGRRSGSGSSGVGAVGQSPHSPPLLSHSPSPLPRAGVSALRKVWVSRASARQRAGRAGRVAPGTVYRLYPKAFYERGMDDWDTPEMVRMPLDRVVLRAKLLGVPSLHSTLAEAIVPPPRSAVDTSVNALLRLGALARKWSPPNPPHSSSSSANSNNNPSQRRPPATAATAAAASVVVPSAEDDGLAVTPLGHLLASVPLDFRFGRLIALASPLGCAAEGVVLACVLSSASSSSGSDVFTPLASPFVATASAAGGAGGVEGMASRQFALGVRQRQRWDRRLYSEPLAALEAFKQWLLFRHRQRQRRQRSLLLLQQQEQLHKEGVPSGVVNGNCGNNNLNPAASRGDGRGGGTALSGQRTLQRRRKAAAAAAAAAEREEEAWCVRHGLVKRMLQELQLKVTEVAARLGNDYLPSFAAHQLKLLFWEDGDDNDAEPAAAAAATATLSSPTPTACTKSNINIHKKHDDDDDNDPRLCGLSNLGRDVPTMRLLLLSVSISQAPFGLLRASLPKLKPPKPLARYPHAHAAGVTAGVVVGPSSAGSSGGGSGSSEGGSSPLFADPPIPMGARCALLSKVSFRQCTPQQQQQQQQSKQQQQEQQQLPPTTVTAAQSLLRSSLEAVAGPIARVEFIPPTSSSSSSSSSSFPGPTAAKTAKAAAAQHLAGGSWVVEFAPTSDAERHLSAMMVTENDSSSSSCTSSSNSGAAGGGSAGLCGEEVSSSGSSSSSWLPSATVVAMAAEVGGGSSHVNNGPAASSSTSASFSLKDLHVSDLPIGLKVLASLKSLPRMQEGGGLKLPVVVTTTTTSSSSSSSSKNSSSSKAAAAGFIRVGDVRWSFSTSWHASNMVVSSMFPQGGPSTRNLRAPSHAVLSVIPGRGSLLSFATNTNATNHLRTASAAATPGAGSTSGGGGSGGGSGGSGGFAVCSNLNVSSASGSSSSEGSLLAFAEGTSLLPYDSGQLLGALLCLAPAGAHLHLGSAGGSGGGGGGVASSDSWLGVGVCGDNDTTPALSAADPSRGGGGEFLVLHSWASGATSPSSSSSSGTPVGDGGGGRSGCCASPMLLKAVDGEALALANDVRERLSASLAAPCGGGGGGGGFFDPSLAPLLHRAVRLIGAKANQASFAAAAAAAAAAVGAPRNAAGVRGGGGNADDVDGQGSGGEALLVAVPRAAEAPGKRGAAAASSSSSSCLPGWRAAAGDLRTLVDLGLVPEDDEVLSAVPSSTAVVRGGAGGGGVVVVGSAVSCAALYSSAHISDSAIRGSDGGVGGGGSGGVAALRAASESSGAVGRTQSQQQQQQQFLTAAEIEEQELAAAAEAAEEESRGTMSQVGDSGEEEEEEEEDDDDDAGQSFFADDMDHAAFISSPPPPGLVSSLPPLALDYSLDRSGAESNLMRDLGMLPHSQLPVVAASTNDLTAAASILSRSNAVGGSREEIGACIGSTRERDHSLEETLSAHDPMQRLFGGASLPTTTTTTTAAASHPASGVSSISSSLRDSPPHPPAPDVMARLFGNSSSLKGSAPEIQSLPLPPPPPPSESSITMEMLFGTPEPPLSSRPDPSATMAMLFGGNSMPTPPTPPRGSSAEAAGEMVDLSELEGAMLGEPSEGSHAFFS